MIKVPGFVRFSLATLLLVCVFIGALMGLARTYRVWQHVMTLRFDSPIINNQIYCGFSSAAFDSTSKRLAVYSIATKSVMVFDLTLRQKMWETKLSMSGRISSQFLKNDTVVQFNDEGDLHVFFSVGDGNQVPENELVNPSSQSNNVEWIVSKNEKEGEISSIIFVDDGGIACRSKIGDETAWPNYDSGSTGRVTKGEFWETIPGDGGFAARFSNDGNLLAFVHRDRVTIWHRSRDYGWSGMATIPFFWIVLGTGIGLCFKRDIVKSCG